MLSGRPCVGKSTWCARFFEALRSLGSEHVITTVVGMDAAAYAVCDRHNAAITGTGATVPLEAAGASAATEDGHETAAAAAGASAATEEGTETAATDGDKTVSPAPGLFKQNSGTDVDPATLPDGFLTYKAVWDAAHVGKIFSLFEETFDSALRGPGPSVILLDYVYLHEHERAAAIRKVQQAGVAAEDFVCVSFEVGDERNYARKLAERNAARANKHVDAGIVESLLKGASLPSEAEGFGLILRCPAILEEGWEASQQRACDKAIATVKRACNL